MSLNTKVCLKLLFCQYLFFIVGNGVIKSVEGMAQGDPTAWQYTVETIPLKYTLVEVICQSDNTTKIAAYPDDLIAARRIV